MESSTPELATGAGSEQDVFNLETPAPVKVAIHRLRRRFRESIKSEIAQTVTDRAQASEQLHLLLQPPA